MLQKKKKILQCIKKNKKIIQSILAFGLVFGMFAIIMCKTGIFFETNDDRAISEILSGSMTGKPEAHTKYTNYLFTLPLLILYRITVQVPWYGVFLVLMSFFSLYGIVSSIIKLADTWVDTILFMVAGSSLLLLNVKMIGEIQYTSVAGLMSIAGYVVLFLQKEEKKMWIFFAIFELYAFLLRDHAMLMIQPLGAMVVISRGFYEKWEKKQQLQFIGKWVASLLIIFLIGMLGNLIGYGSQEWKEYKQFNKARTELFDFKSIPLYEEVKQILDKYGVSQKEYVGYSNYVVLENDVSVECERELLEYQKSKNNVDNSLNLRKIIQTYKGVTDWGINSIVYILWIAIVVLILIGKKWRLVISILGFFVLNSFVWGYILFRGRTPGRVMLPLLLCELIFLVIFIIKEYTMQEFRWKNIIVLASLIGICFFYSYQVGQEQYRYITKVNAIQQLYISGLKDIQKLCDENKDKKFILDNSSFQYYKGSAFETEIYGPHNYVYTGNWYFHSPSMNDRLKEYFSEDIKEIYLIILEQEDVAIGQKEFYALDYLEEKTGAKSILDDSFTVSNGTAYLVYKYQIIDID